MKIIIAGSRKFNDYHLLKEKCEEAIGILEQNYKFNHIEIISGHANGADKLGESFAKEKGYLLKIFLADWDAYGKSAGYKRNEQMACYATDSISALIAFWDGESKGTQHMIDIAKRLKIDNIFVVRYDIK